VNAHLEVAETNPYGAVQEAQAAELVGLCDAEPGPAIVAGDLNARAGASRTLALLREAGFEDAWDRAGDGPGFTCCQASDLRNPASRLDHRIDFVLYRGAIFATEARVAGDLPLDLPGGVRWASDHAGVACVLRMGDPPPG
jgi:endonuclease/exonuclease/phosphatase (EEP) superfamily protein YafD